MKALFSFQGMVLRMLGLFVRRTTSRRVGTPCLGVWLSRHRSTYLELEWVLGLPSSNRDDKVPRPEIAHWVPLLIANLDGDVDFLRGRGHLTDGWRREKRSRDGS